LAIASGLTATTYGYGELKCGDYNNVSQCNKNATTASGDSFNPNIPAAALAIPKIYRVRPQYIFIRTENSSCIKVLLNDKMAEKYVGSRGLDLTPSAVKALGEKPHKAWSGRIFLCEK
jgi:hypothetical protein